MNNKIKNILFFLVIVGLIFCTYLFLVNNFEKLVPRYDNKISIYSNPEKSYNDNQYWDEFIYKNFSYINFDIVSTESQKKFNKIISKLINYGNANIDDSEKYLYHGKLENTKYGNINFLIMDSYYSDRIYRIVYSDDMKNIDYECYSLYDFYSISEKMQILSETEDFSSISEIDSNTNIEENDRVNIQNVNIGNKEEIINNTSKILKDIGITDNFEPEYMKFSYLYILEDTDNNIIVYYDLETNTILRIIVGF